jgi:hypothetical protein
MGDIRKNQSKPTQCNFKFTSRNFFNLNLSLISFNIEGKKRYNILD